MHRDELPEPEAVESVLEGLTRLYGPSVGGPFAFQYITAYLRCLRALTEEQAATIAFLSAEAARNQRALAVVQYHESDLRFTAQAVLQVTASLTAAAVQLHDALGRHD
jgi:hypothetical protein